MTCPACGAHALVPLYDGGAQPLATLGRPRSAEEAMAAPRLPLDYARCVACGHAFNASFDEARLPAASATPGWGMFNGAAEWASFIRETAARLAGPLPEGALVVEVGHGEGTFLEAVAAARADLRCVGFDPFGRAGVTGRVELRRAPVEPEALPALGAALVVVRHVLEHVAAPLAWLERLALAAGAGDPQRVYLEVPCVDRALEAGRTADFFYEHCQQFTTRSLLTMIERADGALEASGRAYDGEVAWALARVGSRRWAETAREARDFGERARRAGASVRAELDLLAASGRRVCVWGGAGKGAAFLARYGMDRARFPLVVDSDPAKVGTFVAGTGQRIEDPGVLSERPADVVLVPPQWRARDIALEMRRRGLRGAILIEHDGRLVDFERGEHPYAR